MYNIAANRKKRTKDFDKIQQKWTVHLKICNIKNFIIAMIAMMK